MTPSVNGSVSDPRRILLTTNTLILLSLIFLLGGLVKGVVGFGLPTIGIGLGAMLVDIPTAMLLIAVPTILSNGWQIAANGDVFKTARRLWVFLLASVALVPAGIALVIWIPEWPYERLLGLVIVVYSLWSIRGKDWHLPNPTSRTAAVLFGGINAFITGLTGCFSVPGVMYLRGLGLSKTELLCAMGWLYLLSALAMGGSLALFGHSTAQLSGWSVAACLPVGVGLLIGTLIQRRLSEVFFRKVFLMAFAVIGFVLLVWG